MTRVSNRKSKLRFATEAEVRYRGRMRLVVVEVDSNGYTASVRLAGSRMRYEFSWAGLHDWAAEMHVRRQREERKRERAERRKHGSRS
jgi:hypothetical protein